MDDWLLLLYAMIVFVGVTAFLRVLANELEVVEKTADRLRLVLERRNRESSEKEEQGHAAQAAPSGPPAA